MLADVSTARCEIQADVKYSKMKKAAVPAEVSRPRDSSFSSVIYHSFFNVTNTNFCTCDEIA